ncbi:diguanylate cyclase domain-containing protein [Mycobacterium sp. WMMD1722]|uniref:GGDEF domain-containing protein n=1 Tax=Mycobacterium sp. WMMD1722 TaxID=3404117 RepID=UPI003BF60A89
MPTRVDPRPPAPRWHGVGLAAYLGMLALYAAAGRHTAGAGVDPRLYAVLGAAAVLGILGAAAGALRGYQRRRALLIAWPVAALVATILTGAVEPDATRLLPGTITIAFVYLGLTCGRWRSLALVPLGVVAFVVGGMKELPGALPTVLVTAVMWVLVAEVPASLIDRLVKQSELLREVAQTDALTKLLDRTTLAHRLSAHAAGSAVVLLDLDSFKQYNDQYGHDAGDDLLVAFADTLRGSVGDDGMVFRLGGDEFLLLLVGADQSAAERIVDRVRERWSRSGVAVGFSAGIATGEQDLIRIADERMYAAKRSRGLRAD